MNTKKVILITVIVSTVLVVITWLVTTLVLSQRDDQTNEPTGNDTDEQQLDTPEEDGDARLIPIDSSDEQVDVVVEVQDDRSELFDGVEFLEYDPVTDTLIYQSDIRGTPYLYTSGDQATALAPDQIVLNAERLDWRPVREGEIPDVLVEEIGGQTLVIRDTTDFFYEEVGVRAFFYDDTSLLVHEDRGNGVHAFVQRQMADPFTDNFEVSVDIAIIEDETIQSLDTRAFSGDTLFMIVEDADGRHLERLPLKTGERDRVLSDIGRSWEAPSGSGVLVEVLTESIQTLQWVTEVAQPQLITLPARAQSVFAWNRDETQLYVLTGEVVSLEELSGTQSEENENEGEEGERFAVLANELWQTSLSGTEQQRISTFDTPLLVDRFFFDLERKKLVYHDPLATSAVILQDPSANK